jgi:NitT/TauT family transport system substrate-binding protein
MWERRVGLLGLSLATVLSAAACGSSGAPAGAGGTSLEKTSLTVAALPIVDDAPLFLAIRKGYFRQQGLTVIPKIIAQSTLALPDLLHGSVDIVGGGNYVSYFGGQAKGTFDLRVLVAGAACRPGSFGVVAMPSSHITSPAGLAGKTIAVNLTSNIQTLMTNVQLRAAGVSPSSVKYVAIPFPDMGAALTAGRVTAISAVEPFLSGAETAGARQVVSDCAGATANLPLSGYFATAAWTQKYPRTAAAFQRAMAKAQSWANSDPAAVRQILPTYTKITSAAAQAIHLETYPASTDPAQLQRVAILMRSGGLLAKPFSVQSMIFR